MSTDCHLALGVLEICSLALDVLELKLPVRTGCAEHTLALGVLELARARCT